ncbi:nuclear pore protein 84/107 [Flagelloscypha sp. PMI_526]|nr:nuclear pore protein 84/107 [Flagelloscypha sp. PMI_526]
MSSPPAPAESYASLYTLFQSQTSQQSSLAASLSTAPQNEGLDALLDPETGFCPRIQTLCRTLLEDRHSSSTELLKKECETWGLIQGLIGNRLYASSHPPPAAPKSSGRGSWTSQRQLVDSLITSSPTLTELVIVREWLMDVYREFGPRIPVEYASTTGYWRFTHLRALTEQNKSLDPDKGCKNLAQDDVASDQLLFQILYQLIRAGRLDEAYEVCERSHQPWRAASLRGGLLFGWPRIARLAGAELEEEEEDDDYTGNLSRALWKKTCLRIALSPSLTSAERLVYASLVPDHQLAHVLRSGQSGTWHDALWIAVSTLVEARVEEGLTEHKADSGYDGIWGEEDIWLDEGADDDAAVVAKRSEKDWETDVLETLEGLRRNHSISSGPDPSHPIYSLQLGLITNNLTPTLEAFVTWFEQPRNQTPEAEHLLRFFTHLCLFLRLTGMDGPLDQDVVRRILEGYVSVLERSTYTALIPLYTQALGSNAIERYSAYLITHEPLRSIESRREALSRASETSLDPLLVAVRTAEKSVEKALSILPQPLHYPFPDLLRMGRCDTETEEFLVRSLEWTVLRPETYPVAIEQACVIIRWALGMGRLPVARRVAAMCKEWGVDPVGPDEAEGGAFHLPPQTLAEHIDYTHFFDIHALFDKVDVALSALPPSSSPLHGQRLSELEDVVKKLNERVLAFLTKRIWLVAPFHTQEDEEEGKRDQELRRVRKIWIPEIILRFVSVCRSVGGDLALKAALELVNVIADSRYGVFHDFGGRDEEQGSKKLRELLLLMQQVVVQSTAGGDGDLFRLVRRPSLL